MPSTNAGLDAMGEPCRCLCHRDLANCSGKCCTPERLTRDPRLDPRPGDVLIYGPQWQRERVEVLSVSDGVIYRYSTWRYTSATLEQWREYMVDAEVIHAAD